MSIDRDFDLPSKVREFDAVAGTLAREVPALLNGAGVTKREIAELYHRLDGKSKAAAEIYCRLKEQSADRELIAKAVEVCKIFALLALAARARLTPASDDVAESGSSPASGICAGS